MDDRLQNLKNFPNLQFQSVHRADYRAEFSGDKAETWKYRYSAGTGKSYHKEPGEYEDDAEADVEDFTRIRSAAPGLLAVLVAVLKPPSRLTLFEPPPASVELLVHSGECYPGVVSSARALKA